VSNEYHCVARFHYDYNKTALKFPKIYLDTMVYLVAEKSVKNENFQSNARSVKFSHYVKNVTALKM
jgi:hypothetical protein